MIIKVQASISSSEEVQQCLVYTKDRKLMFQQAMTPEISELLDGRLKAFFIAQINNKNILEILDHCVDQDW